MSGLLRWLPNLLERMSSSWLLALLGIVFVADLVVMDPLPFVDEILIGAVTLLLARWKGRRDDATDTTSKPPPKNITPD